MKWWIAFRFSSHKNEGKNWNWPFWRLSALVLNIDQIGSRWLHPCILWFGKVWQAPEGPYMSDNIQESNPYWSRKHCQSTDSMLAPTYKVTIMHILVNYLTQTPIFEWCMVRCGSKNEHQRNMCSKEIGLCAENFITIPGSIVNIIRRFIAPACLTLRNHSSNMGDQKIP